jgi:TolB protein
MVFDRSPDWSPDGKSVAFSRAVIAGHRLVPRLSGLFIVSANGSHLHRLTPALGAFPHWGGDGKTIYFLRQGKGSNGVFSIPSGGGKPRRLTRTGDVNTMDVAPDGRLVLERSADLFLADSQAHIISRLTKTKTVEETYPAVAPDGKRLAFVRDTSVSTLVVLELATGKETSLLHSGRTEFTHPTWSPDGKRIVFARERHNGRGNDLWEVSVGSGSAHAIVHMKREESEPAWAPRGDRIAFVSAPARYGSSRIYTVSASGRGLIRG